MLLYISSCSNTMNVSISTTIMLTLMSIMSTILHTCVASIKNLYYWVYPDAKPKSKSALGCSSTPYIPHQKLPPTDRTGVLRKMELGSFPSIHQKRMVLPYHPYSSKGKQEGEELNPTSTFTRKRKMGEMEDLELHSPMETNQKLFPFNPWVQRRPQDQSTRNGKAEEDLELHSPMETREKLFPFNPWINRKPKVQTTQKKNKANFGVKFSPSVLNLSGYAGSLRVQTNKFTESISQFFMNVYTGEICSQHRRGVCTWCTSPLHRMEQCTHYRSWISQCHGWTSDKKEQKLEEALKQGQYVGRHYHPYCEKSNGVYQTPQGIPLLVYDNHIINVFPKGFMEDNCYCYPNFKLGSPQRRTFAEMPTPDQISKMKMEHPFTFKLPMWVKHHTQKLQDALARQKQKIKDMHQQISKTTSHLQDSLNLLRRKAPHLKEERFRRKDAPLRQNTSQAQRGLSIWQQKVYYGCKNCHTPIYWSAKEGQCLKCGNTQWSPPKKNHSKIHLPKQIHWKYVPLKKKTTGLSNCNRCGSPFCVRPNQHRDISGRDSVPIQIKITLSSFLTSPETQETKEFYGCTRCETPKYWSLIMGKCRKCYGKDFLSSKHHSPTDCHQSYCFDPTCYKNKCYLKDKLISTTTHTCGKCSDPDCYRNGTISTVILRDKGPIPAKDLYSPYGCTYCETDVHWDNFKGKCTKCGGNKYISKEEHFHLDCPDPGCLDPLCKQNTKHQQHQTGAMVIDQYNCWLCQEPSCNRRMTVTATNLKISKVDNKTFV